MLINLLMFAHVVISILLIVLVLLQRSDGGLGSLGGSGGEALMTAASAGNALSRLTKWLFTLLVVLTLGLAVQMAGHGAPQSVVLGGNAVEQQALPVQPSIPLEVE